MEISTKSDLEGGYFCWGVSTPLHATLLSKFPQIITYLTEDTELAFTEKLERSYLIIILLTVLLSHILNESNSNIVVEFSYECS